MKSRLLKGPLRCKQQKDRRNTADIRSSRRMMMKRHRQTSAFHVIAATTRKARVPLVDSSHNGTISLLVAADRSMCRPDTSARRQVSGHRYHGAVPRKTL